MSFDLAEEPGGLRSRSMADGGRGLCLGTKKTRSHNNARKAAADIVSAGIGVNSRGAGFDYRADDLFRAAAARMSVLKASSSISSPSWKSIARLTLPSRLELNSLEGSLSEAPLKKVSFTTLLYVSPVQIPPL